MVRPIRYEKVFTPGAPGKGRHYLFGRDQELNDLRRVIKRPGLHPIVIGNRGVGKTSVTLQAFANFKPPIIRVGCNPDITFQKLARQILRGVGYDTNEIESKVEKHKEIGAKALPFGVGVAAAGTKTKSLTRREIGEEELDPWEVFRLLKELKKKFIIIIDEYDAIPPRNSDVHTPLAYLIKTLADNSGECDTRIVIVGVARSSQELLGRHESIERSAREIYLRPLRREDVNDFLTEAETRLKFKFSADVIKDIVWGSMGYPYYVHLVGLECLDAMIERNKKSRIVKRVDFTKAIQSAVQKAFRAELKKRQETTQRFRFGMLWHLRLQLQLSVCFLLQFCYSYFPCSLPIPCHEIKF